MNTKLNSLLNTILNTKLNKTKQIIMKRFNVGIKLKSGLCYSTSVRAESEGAAVCGAIDRATKSGFSTKPVIFTKVLYIIEK